MYFYLTFGSFLPHNFVENMTNISSLFDTPVDNITEIWHKVDHKSYCTNLAKIKLTISRIHEVDSCDQLSLDCNWHISSDPEIFEPTIFCGELQDARDEAISILRKTLKIIDTAATRMLSCEERLAEYTTEPSGHKYKLFRVKFKWNDGVHTVTNPVSNMQKAFENCESTKSMTRSGSLQIISSVLEESTDYVTWIEIASL